MHLKMQNFFALHDDVKRKSLAGEVCAKKNAARFSQNFRNGASRFYGPKVSLNFSKYTNIVINISKAFKNDNVSWHF